jgi:hypothetical protein
MMKQKDVIKISAHGVGAALAAVLVWALGAFAKVAVPAEVSVAFGTLAAAGVSYLLPDEVEE